MTVEEAKKLFTKRELKEIEKHIKEISEKDADFLIGLLQDSCECGKYVFGAIKVVAALKTTGLIKIPTGKSSWQIVIQNVGKRNRRNYLIIKGDPQREVKKLLLQYYPSSDDVIRNALKTAIIEPDSDTEMHGYIISTEDEPNVYMDMHSYIRFMVDVYDEDPQTQTGEMYLFCRACKKCKVA